MATTRNGSIFDMARTLEINTPFAEPAKTVNAAPKTPEGKRVYYVLRNTGFSKNYVSKVAPTGFYFGSLKEAQRFATVNDLLDAIRARGAYPYGHDPLEIVRVEETTVPGGLREVPLATPGAKVVLKDCNPGRLAGGFACGFFSRESSSSQFMVRDLSNATVFSNLQDALRALQSAVRDLKIAHTIVNNGLEPVGVARTEPMVTTMETVLD